MPLKLFFSVSHALLPDTQQSTYQLWQLFDILLLIPKRIVLFVIVLLSRLFFTAFNMASALCWDLKHNHIQITVGSFFLVPILTPWKDIFCRESMIWTQDPLYFSYYFYSICTKKKKGTSFHDYSLSSQQQKRDWSMRVLFQHASSKFQVLFTAQSDVNSSVKTSLTTSTHPIMVIVASYLYLL